MKTTPAGTDSRFPFVGDASVDPLRHLLHERINPRCRFRTEIANKNTTAGDGNWQYFHHVALVPDVMYMALTASGPQHAAADATCRVSPPSGSLNFEKA